MNICLVGGSGFIGTQLMNLLVAEHNVTILDRIESTPHAAKTTLVDVRDPEGVVRNLVGQDVVVLLAAAHRDDLSPPSLYYDVNVEGTKNVLAGMRHHDIKKIVFTSTAAVYGLDRESPSEEDEVAPFGHYGKSKFLAEEELREWQLESKDRDVTIIRPTVVFGEGNRGNVYNLLRQIRSRRFVMIGSGQNQKSMAYVVNVARFLQFCIENRDAGYKLFNYVDKPDLSMEELVTLVRAQMGRRGSPLRVPYWLGMAVGHSFDCLSALGPRSSSISSVRIKKFCATTTFKAERLNQIGFKPVVSLKEGIERTIRAEFS